VKFIKSYKFILFLTFIFIFLNLFSILYIDQRALPSDHWSKEINLETYPTNNRYDTFEKKDNAFLKIDNHFYLIYFSENSYSLNAYDEKMDFIKHVSINKDYNLVDHLNAKVIGDEIEINFTTDQQLISLMIDTKGNVLSENIIDDQIIDVQYHKNDIAYLKEDGIYLNTVLIHPSKNIENFSFTSNNGTLNFPYIKYNLETYKYDLKMLKYNEKLLSDDYLYTFFFDNVTNIFDLDLSLTTDKNTLVVITENIKSNLFTNIFFTLDNDFSILNRELNYSSGYNFKFLENSSDYIQNTQTNIGKIDVSTKNNKYSNVALFKSNGQINPLTKTKSFPNKVNYYTYNDYHYIIFSQSNNSKEISLYLASTDPTLIKKSQQLSINQMKSLILNTLTTFLPLFLFGQIYSILFLIPIFVIILPFSLIKITWAEQNQGKLLVASIALFLLAKSKYVLFDMQLHGLPIIFTNPILRLLMALTLSTISIYCMIDFSRNKNNHFFRNFIVFFIIDMITFTLFFTPYFLL